MFADYTFITYVRNIHLKLKKRHGEDYFHTFKKYLEVAAKPKTIKVFPSYLYS